MENLDPTDSIATKNSGIPGQSSWVHSSQVDKDGLTCQLSDPSLKYTGYIVDARLILVVEQVILLVVEQVILGKAGDVQHEVQHVGLQMLVRAHPHIGADYRATSTRDAIAGLLVAERAGVEG